MVSTLQILISLLAVIAAVGVASKRSKVPAAILLVVTGVVLALIPGLPAIELAPQLVLLLILPPIIYMSAVAMSWREFRFNLRPIVLLAFGSVIFTTVAIAAACPWLLVFPWPVGFVLGAGFSPADGGGPLSIARRMQLPGASWSFSKARAGGNDATALILYRFAVGVVSYGAFSFSQAAGLFGAIVVGEILWGIGVGWLMLRLRARSPIPASRSPSRFSPPFWPIGRRSISAAPACSPP
jgi:CPA1 family monovalent cation:H+ antiporter